jgi:Tfp pilus assembly protein PilF
VVSLLSLKAPRDAKKNFDKGTEQARANKLADAAASFQKSVASYPQYADAWLSLGKVQEQLGAKDAAREDFQKAMDLDDKLVGRGRNWATWHPINRSGRMRRGTWITRCGWTP